MFKISYLSQDGDIKDFEDTPDCDLDHFWNLYMAYCISLEDFEELYQTSAYFKVPAYGGVFKFVELID